MEDLRAGVEGYGIDLHAGLLYMDLASSARARDLDRFSSFQSRFAMNPNSKP